MREKVSLGLKHDKQTGREGRTDIQVRGNDRSQWEGGRELGPHRAAGSTAVHLSHTSCHRRT